MTAHVQHQVEANVNVHDKASGPLGLIAKAAGRMNNAFEHATNLVGTFAGGMAAGFAAFEIGDAVKETSEFVKQIDRMSVISKMPVARTEALVRTFEKAGVGASEVEGIMFRLNRQADKLDFRMDHTGKSIKTGPLAMMEEMGVSLRDGPDKAMIALADKVKAGRIDVSRLASAFWLSKDKAYDLHKVLVQGGDQLKKNLEEAKKHNIVNATLLAANKKFVQAQRDMKLGWEHIKQAFGAAMIPVLAELTEKVARNMDQWVEKAREFGETLGKFLKQHHQTILTIGKLLVAQFSLQKLTGRGIVGTAGMMLGGAKALTGLLGFGAGGGAAAGGTAAAGGAAAAGGVALGPLLAVIAAIAAIVGAIYITWKAISQNVNGIKDKLVAVWDRIAVHFEAIWETFKATASPLLKWLDKVFSKQGGFGKFMMTLLPMALLNFLKAVELALHFARAAHLYAQMMWEQWKRVWGILVRLKNDLTDLFMDIYGWVASITKTVVDATTGAAKEIAQANTDLMRWIWDGLTAAANAVYPKVVKVWHMIADAVAGVATGLWRSYIGPFVNNLIEGFSGMGKAIAGLFGGVADETGSALGWVADKFSKLFHAIQEGVNWLWNFIKNSWVGKAIGGAIDWGGSAYKTVDNAVGELVRQITEPFKRAGTDIKATLTPIQTWKEAWRRIDEDTKRDAAARRKAAEEEKRTEPGEERDGPPHYDFRGSKFDITQKFAEGFDPDRIAVAFANDLAAMGERKLQSGFSPIYSAM